MAGIRASNNDCGIVIWSETARRALLGRHRLQPGDATTEERQFSSRAPSSGNSRRDDGGGGRNRTGVHGFAGRCMTTLPPRQERRRRACRSGEQTKGESLMLSPRVWSGKRVSNSRPQPWQGCALPTELFPRERKLYHCERNTVPIASATYSMFFEFKAATQMRPVSTA